MHIDRNRGFCSSNSIAAVTFVWLIIGFDYYVFVFLFLKRLFEISLPISIFIMFEFHIFVVLLVWSYIKTILTGPGYLSRNINDHFQNVEYLKEKQKRLLRYKLNYKKNDVPEILQARKEDDARDLENINEDEEKLKQIAKDPILQLNDIGYCFKCNAVKLPRAHHCRQCQRCVLRMDHHCPWVGNCIGKYNHKYFILSLIYAVILLLQIFIWEALFYYLNFENFREGLSSEVRLILMVSSSSSIAVFFALSILTGFQIYAATKNITTIEIHLKGILQRNPFNKGASKNLESLFGTNKKLWFLPVEQKFPSEEEHLLLEEF